MSVKLLSVKELRGKKEAELTKYVSELQAAHRELIHALYTNKETKTHTIRAIKKSIARTKTILTIQSKEEK